MSNAGIYSIGAVARMLDIPVATIRNWEDRYAAVVPERSAGGQRLYSHEHVEALRFVASQVARGLSAADAHRLLAEGRAGPSSQVGEPADDGRPLVLIAERDAVAAQLAEAVLRAQGYAVELVFGAAVAEALWQERRPRLAIVELMISGGRGAGLCLRLKQHDFGAVLATSALDGRDDAMAAGADAFLQKPVDPLDLAATVNELVTARARGAA